MMRHRTLVILLLVLALLATACSSSVSDSSNSSRGSSGELSSSPSPERTEAPPQHETEESPQYETEALPQYETDASPQYDQPPDEPDVDDEVEELVDQVDDTSVDVASGSEVLTASAVDSQDASSQNAEAIAAADAYLTAALANADQAWTYWFTSNGLTEPLVSYDVITPAEPGWRSNCGDLQVVSDTPNAFYCSEDALQPGFDGAIYLPATTMLKMWSGDIFGRQSQQAGDFAAAAIVAHEFGHHVQDELSYQTNTLPPNGKNKELIADCFAGNWAADVYYQGYLEAGDFEEAVFALEAIGDLDDFSPDPHGTSEEREAAFQLGYHGVQGGTPGDPATCIQYYWR